MRTEFLASKRILYAVVDAGAIRDKHELLFKKLLDLTIVLTQRLTTIAYGHVQYFQTIDAALSCGRLWDLVIVQSVGNFIVDYRFIAELDVLCAANSNFFLLTVPPTSRNISYADRLEFDPRMMVLNVETWRQLGFPSIEARQEVDVTSDLSPTRFETIDSPRTSSTVGRNFLSVVMRRGLEIVMFPERIREYTLYLWPEVDSDRLYEALCNRDESLVSNSEQKKWIQLCMPRSTIWIYNSEPYRFVVPPRNCDVYFGPAAGFKFLDAISHSPTCQLVIYDQNEESLAWISTLKREWDGNDFPGYIDRQPDALRGKFKYPHSTIGENEMVLFEQFDGNEAFKKLWGQFRDANAHFVKCNLFNSEDVCALTTKWNAKRPYFYYSNIFSTICTLMAFSREEAEERYSRFKSIVKRRFPEAVMHGADVRGRWQ